MPGTQEQYRTPPPSPDPVASRGHRTFPHMAELTNAVLNNAMIASIATDVNGVIQTFAVGAERMFGVSASKVVHRLTPADLVNPADLVAIADQLRVEFGVEVKPSFAALS